MTDKVIVREFEARDAPQLLSLMKELASFEDYLDDFAVTEVGLLRHGLGEKALFHAFMVESEGQLIGMAVTYEIPWTYTLRPRLILKEFFVTAEARGTGAGRALMTKVIRKARVMNADQVLWTVLDGNQDAERFYLKLGGRPDRKWNNWRLDI